MKGFIILFIFVISSVSLFSNTETANLIRVDSISYEEFNHFKLSTPSQVIFIDSLIGIRSLFDIADDEQGFLIQKTINGGYDWETIFVDTLIYLDTTIDGKEFISAPRLLKKIHFFKNGKIILECSSVSWNTGQSRNKGCSIITSEDSGINWNEVKNDTLKNMNYLYYKEKPIMWMEFVKEFYYKPFLYHRFFATTNDGKSWEKIVIPEKLINFKFMEIVAVDENTVLFMFCDDSTPQWTYYPHFYKIKEKYFEEYNIPKDLLTSKAFIDISLRTIDDAILKVNRVFERDSITGNAKQWETYLVRTTDRWQTRDTILDMSIFTKYYKKSLLKKCIYFDSLNLIAYGYNYDLVKTSDGGKSWTHLQINELAREQYDSLIYYNVNNINSDSIIYLHLLTFFTGISWPELGSCFVFCNERVWSPGIIYKVNDKINGIKDDKTYNSGQFYPNPVSDFARLKLDNEFPGLVSISLVDLLGNSTEIYKGEASGGVPLDLNISRFPTGFYSLLIDYGTKREVVKVIKQ